MRLPWDQLTLLRLRYVSASYTSLVRPKSDIFRTLPLPTKTFLAARSRWTSWKGKKATSNTKHTPVSGLWGIYYVFLTLWTQGWLGLIFFLLNQFLIMGYHDSKCIAFRWSSSKKINCKKQPYLLPWFHWDIAFLLRFAKQTTTGLWCWGVLAPWSSHSLTVTWSIVCNGD